ncbi:VTT domain-containing protein [Streptomyces sp. NPDC051940]|uniref:DedA family protein n=1 Tax=Streptomyces sp. NPDC051940 TaxID=3155675 RepID=UPI003445520A
MYAIIAISVLLDVFLPVLPSGALVIMAATAAAGTSTAASAVREGAAVLDKGGHLPELLGLVLCAATASVVGDLVAYRLAYRGGERLDRALARSRRLTAAQERLGSAVSRGGGALVVLARFAPAGRSVVSLSAGVAHRTAREFLPWSALAGFVWAAYGVGLGYLGSQWLGAGWVATGVSVLALFLAGLGAAYVVRRPRTA